MLLYHVAYYMPRQPGETEIRAVVLDFPGIALQGFDLSEIRRQVGRDLLAAAQAYRDSGRELPAPDPLADAPAADLLEIMPVDRIHGA